MNIFKRKTNQRKWSGIVVDQSALWRLAMPFYALLIVNGLTLAVISTKMSSVSQTTELSVESEYYAVALASTIRLYLTAGFVVQAVLVGILWIIWSHRIFGPLVPLRRHITKLIDGNYSDKVTLRKKDELKSLADDLNRLTERLRNSQGQALVQVLVSVGIMGILIMTFTAMMQNQSTESRALSEKMASTDFQQQLIRVFADGSLCTHLFGGKTFDSTNATEGSPNPPYLELDSNILPSSDLPSSPALATAGQPISSLSSTLRPIADKPFKIAGIVGSSQAGVGKYIGEFQVRFDQPKLVRPIRNAQTQIAIQTTTSGTTETITACRSTAVGGTQCGLRTVICVGFNPTPIYDFYGSDSIPCAGSELTTDCLVHIPANFPQSHPQSVSGCPPGYSGKFVATGVYFIGTAYQNHYHIFCAK